MSKLKPENSTNTSEFKEEKISGEDEFLNELVKYGQGTFVQQLTKLIKKIPHQIQISNEWQTSTTILMFKKWDKKYPQTINILYYTDNAVLVAENEDDIQRLNWFYRAAKSCNMGISALKIKYMTTKIYLRCLIIKQDLRQR